MTARVLDGVQVSSGGRTFTYHDEPPDEDGHGARWYTCDDCNMTIRGGSDGLSDHECVKCPGCDEWFLTLPVTDSENGQAYCTDDCHQDASERYWTAVWTS